MPISPLNKETLAVIQAKIDNKTKPLGALGALEPLALQLALITAQRQQGSLPITLLGNISIEKPTMLVFAGDHGINEENLSIAPSTVTHQMVVNFLQGGAAINCFCQSNDIALTVIDCGILESINLIQVTPLFDNKKHVVKLIEQRLGAGTNNFSVEAAMSISQVKQGFEYAENAVKAQITKGMEILLLGEMGIANTSSAAALMSALTAHSVSDCVGRGTGITDKQLSKKIDLIEKALVRIHFLESAPKVFTREEVLDTLAELGGFEIVQMVSAILNRSVSKYCCRY